MKKKIKKNLLFHVCCAPCASYISSVRLAPHYNITWYFDNPNILSQIEYDRRLDMVKLMADKFNFDLIIEPYEHQGWLEMTRGHERDPEGGARCMLCYHSRLRDTVKLAKAKNFDLFGTSLLVSPYKDIKALRSISRALAKEYKISFLDEDFQADNGYQHSQNLARELGLYRQKFCGCEYSVLTTKAKNLPDDVKKCSFMI